MEGCWVKKEFEIDKVRWKTKGREYNEYGGRYE